MDDATQASSWPINSLQSPPNSTTSDNGLTNQQLAQIASSLGDQSGDTSAGLTAILNAITAKPSA